MPEVPSPDWFSWEFWAQNRESIRDLVITFAALVGIPFVIWREVLHHRQTAAALHQAEIARQQAATAQRRHEAQVEADRERRITDNFTRAVEQLGSDKLATRLGAIYALERIARESKDDHWPIMETLTGYIRERASWRPIRGDEDEPEVQPERVPPATDIQACLTVIGRRHREHDLIGQRLQLQETDLRDYDLNNVHFEEADLVRTHLEGANLDHAHLERAILISAHLQKARLGDAQLEGAALTDAYLERAYLGGACLKRACCYNARLTNADLLRAHFEGANLTWARLDNALFEETHLEGADLSDSTLTQKQFDSAITDEHTKVPPHIKRPPPGQPVTEVAEGQRVVTTTAEAAEPR